MGLNYKTIATIESVIFAGLFVLYGFLPGQLLDGWGVPVTDDTRFMATRLASAFVSLTVILWLTRDLGPGKTRQAIGLGIGLTLIAVAAFGVKAYLTGVASAGIFTAIGFEVTMAIALIYGAYRQV